MKILGVTTDPSKLIQGYSLEFQRMMGILSKKYKVTVLTNAYGRSYGVIKDSPNFSDNPNLTYALTELKKQNYFLKGLEFILANRFFKGEWDLVISNNELPDLVLSCFLCSRDRIPKMAVIHDDYLRGGSMRIKAVYWLKTQIIKKYDILLFVNNHTLRSMKKKHNLKSELIFIGNAVCDNNGQRI